MFVISLVIRSSVVRVRPVRCGLSVGLADFRCFSREALDKSIPKWKKCGPKNTGVLLHSVSGLHWKSGYLLTFVLQNVRLLTQTGKLGLSGASLSCGILV